MENVRKYGKPPFTIAVIHGGPGAPGEMASVAKELCSIKGVLEPLQTATTVKGQVRELKNVIEKNTNLPITIIGWSWGAWLSFIFTAEYPSFVKKLILIGSGAFEEKYATNIMDIRLSRLDDEEREEVCFLIKILSNPTQKNKNNLMARLGTLLFKADSYDPINEHNEIIECQYDIFRKISNQGSELRRSGKLLEFGKNIKCPVIAIHGDYDPHLFVGVKDPLSRTLKDFRFIILKNCGHYPWIEKSAKEKFYTILKKEIE